MSDPQTLTAEPLSPRTLPGLLALFDATGSSCFCRYQHFGGDKNEWLARLAFSPDENRDELSAKALAGDDEAAGIVALSGDEVVGWSTLAWADTVKKIYEQRYYRGLAVLRREPTGVLTLGCFLVHHAHRRKGVAHALVRGAIASARTRGARAIEAFPRVSSEPLQDEELWTGVASTLVAAGFVAVNDEPPYPVFRLALT
jgi:GNAT superfamily N-acetyltransferase